MRGMDSTYTSYMVNGIKQGTRESRPYGHHIGTEAAFTAACCYRANRGDSRTDVLTVWL
jgi:hypothetical protein